MPPGGDLSENRSVSCPFCGRRSSISIPMPGAKPKTWIHHCPACGKPWKVSVEMRRGRTELDVTPHVRGTDKPKS